jgi:hypothetical protein
MLATPEGIEHLADGVYSSSELEELHIKRRAEERSAGSQAIADIRQESR